MIKKIKPRYENSPEKENVLKNRVRFYFNFLTIPIKS